MIRYAQVIAVHPERRTVDVAMSDTGERIGEADVLSGSVSSDAGEWDIPDVQKPSTEAAAGGLSGGGRVVMACVEFTASGRAVVTGFVHPAGGQMNFNQANRSVRRHPSGAYTTVAPDGSIEHYHPGGAYLRIGTGAHEDLTPISADGNWTLPAAPAPQITLVTAGFTLTIEPGGATTLTSQGDVTLNVTGTVAVYAAAIQLGKAAADTLRSFCTSIFDAWARGHTHSNGNQGANTGPPTTLPPDGSLTAIVTGE